MLVALEGIDGSGKGTQAALLCDGARAAGYSVMHFSFPQYGSNPFAAAVSKYLTGSFGATSNISPYLSALLYAGDRFCAAGALREALERVDLVVCDRHVPSNVAHQAAKISDAERDGFIQWIEEIEYGWYAIPRADLVVLLDIPVGIAVQLIAKKAARSYTSLSADFHERDTSYLESCAAVYRQIAAREPSAWHIERVMSGDDLRDQSSIQESIWRRVEDLLVA